MGLLIIGSGADSVQKGLFLPEHRVVLGTKRTPPFKIADDSHRNTLHKLDSLRHLRSCRGRNLRSTIAPSSLLRRSAVPLPFASRSESRQIQKNGVSWRDMVPGVVDESVRMLKQRKTASSHVLLSIRDT